MHLLQIAVSFRTGTANNFFFLFFFNHAIAKKVLSMLNSEEYFLDSEYLHTVRKKVMLIKNPS